MSRYKQPYSLYKRGKYWYYRTYDERGIRTSGISTGQTSKNAAKDFCNKLYLTGSLYSCEKRFSDYATHFFDDKSPYLKDRVTPLAENTVTNYRKILNNYLLPYFKDCKLSDITYTKLKAFRIKMLNEYSVSAVTSTMSCLKHIIEYAYRDRLIPENPFTYLEPLNAHQEGRDAFTIDEVRQLYNAIPAEFKKTVLLMALTGMRISEAVGVTDADILQQQDFFYIHLKKQFNNKKYKELKNKEKRDIPVIAEIKELIGFDDMRLSAFYREYNNIKKTFDRAEERKLCFHSLRHFFITNAKSEGINESKVEVIAGHSLRGITKVYTNFSVEDLKDILQWQEKTIAEIKTAPESTKQEQQKRKQVISNTDK